MFLLLLTQPASRLSSMRFLPSSHSHSHFSHITLFLHCIVLSNTYSSTPTSFFHLFILGAHLYLSPLGLYLLILHIYYIACFIFPLSTSASSDKTSHFTSEPPALSHDVFISWVHFASISFSRFLSCSLRQILGHLLSSSSASLRMYSTHRAMFFIFLRISHILSSTRSPAYFDPNLLSS